MEETTTFTHVVTPEEDGELLETVLRRQFRFSKRMMRILKHEKRVMVNGDWMFFRSRVQEADQIRIELNIAEDVEYIAPEKIPFTVIEEDEDLIVVDKPPNTVVHPTGSHQQGTLANGLVHYWQQRGENHKIRPVTRLDRNTSGLMVLAKHAYGHAFLADQMAKKRYERSYLAVIHGNLIHDQGTIDLPIGKVPDVPLLRFIDFSEEGSRAVTHYEVVERFAHASVLRLWLETGRTHQIRVHLSSIGHPIIGDELYGRGEEEQHLIGRQALHATSLKLYHPRTRDWVEWEAPMPEDLQQLLQTLRMDL